MAEFDPKDLEKPIKYNGLRYWFWSVAGMFMYLYANHEFERAPVIIKPLYLTESASIIFLIGLALSFLGFVICFHLMKYKGKEKLNFAEGINFSLQIHKARHFKPVLYLAIFIALFELWIYLN